MASGPDPIKDVDRETGEWIQGWTRAKQSIVTILTTRLRTRLMRLWWGSEFLNLQDKPATMEVFVRSIGAAANAINLYEPEFEVQTIKIDSLNANGECMVTVDGVYIPEGVARRTQFPVF
jgi:phage baseplate assembly protein W